MLVVKRNAFDEPFASTDSTRPSKWRIKKSTFSLLVNLSIHIPMYKTYFVPYAYWLLQFWNETSESTLFGPEIIRQAERKVREIRENIRTGQSKYKSYADTWRWELSFEEGDYVYLKASPGWRRFKVKGKLAPHCIRPFKVLEQRGEVAYQLELPSQLSDVCNVFHIS